VKWPSLGHMKPVSHLDSTFSLQGFPRNQFAEDFKKHEYKWSASFCQLDSDGDGITNGEELGDPDCRWNVGDPDPTSTVLTHPGLNQTSACEIAESNKGGPLWFSETTGTELYEPKGQWYHYTILPLGFLVAFVLLRVLELPKPRWSIVALISYLMNHIGVFLCNHRMLSHRAFEVNNPTKFVLCYFGTIAHQGPPVWWAAVHRIHHRDCEDGYDPHSPYAHNRTSFWSAHMMRCQTPYCSRVKSCARWSDCSKNNVADLLDDDILRTYFNSMPSYIMINVVTALALAAIAVIFSTVGSFGHRYRMLRVMAETACAMVFYLGLPQFLCYHSTMLVNSAVHLWGDEPYHDAMSLPCRSKNNALLWAIHLGENWHNNHHAFPYSATNQINWYQIDLQFAVYKVLEGLNFAWRTKVKMLHPQAMEYQWIEGHDSNALWQTMLTLVAMAPLSLAAVFSCLRGLRKRKEGAYVQLTHVSVDEIYFANVDADANAVATVIGMRTAVS